MYFGGTNLATYGLRQLQTSPLTYAPPIQTNMVEMKDRAYDFAWRLRPRQIKVNAAVTGASLAVLQQYLDILSELLNPQHGLQALILDYPTGRYWNAKVAAPIDWAYISPTAVQGVITFIAPDPRAYDSTQVNDDHTVDADPDTIIEDLSAGYGSAYIEPVILLTPGKDLLATTVTIKNNTTVEQLVITGNWYVGAGTTINVANMTVLPADRISAVSGQFPRLKPRASNSITITNLQQGTNATMKLTYRVTYL